MISWKTVEHDLIYIYFPIFIGAVISILLNKNFPYSKEYYVIITCFILMVCLTINYLTIRRTGI